MLRKAGFVRRSGKGSHTNWTHPKLAGRVLTLSGQDGADARPYQEKLVEEAIREAEANP
jgi:predicted RNA binding protein YcfA (HicA-like mRNA interferase family)